MNKALSAPLERSNSFEDRIFEFLELSQKIMALVKNENTIFGSCGYPTMEAYLENRASLLKSYEDNAQNLVADMLSETIHINTKKLLTAELSAVQAALAGNTAYIFNSPSLNNGDSKWH